MTQTPIPDTSNIASIILASAALLTAGGSFLRGYITDKKKLSVEDDKKKEIKRKDEFELMHTEIERLQHRVGDLEESRNVLEEQLTEEHNVRIILLDYVAQLRASMLEKKMKVPPMPKLSTEYVRIAQSRRRK